MNISNSYRNFGVMYNSPDGLEKLKELILSLAVQGKLTSKLDFNDSVEDLLIAAGKIQKPYPEISDKRFEIPITWKWVPLASIAEHQLGKMLNSSKMKGERRSYLRSLNIRQDGSIDLSDLKEMLLPDTELDKYSVRLGDIFVNEGGDVGRSAIFTKETEIELAFQNALHRLRPLCGIDARYLHIVLQQAKQQGAIARMSAGVTIQHFSASALRRFAVPLPPLSEQKQIVEKVDALINLCGQLSTQQNIRNVLGVAARKSAVDAISTSQTPEELKVAWTRIQSNWEAITGTPEAIDSMKTLILDLAVRGDLISVDSPKIVESIEWTNSELKLDESKIWSLPTLHKERRIGWNRIPLAKLGFWGSGGTPTSTRKDYYQNGTIPWAVIGDLNDGIMTRTEASITEEALADSSSKLVPKGAILIAMYGSIGKTAITGIECCTNQAIAHCIVDTKLVSKDYFFIVAKSLKRHLIQEGKGAAQPNISQSVLKHLIIDLPPLAEQALIVDKVEALMQICDHLKRSLRESEVLAEKFSRSVVSASA